MHYSRGIPQLLLIVCILALVLGCSENGNRLTETAPRETPSAISINGESTEVLSTASPSVTQTTSQLTTSAAPESSATPTLRARVSSGSIDVVWQIGDTIWGSKVDGSGREEIVSGIASNGEGSLALSPDGRRIAFWGNRSRPLGGNGLFVVDRNTGQLDHVTEESGGGLVWSPNGKMLAYEVYRDLGPAPVGALEVRALNVESGHDIALVSARYFVRSLVWMPDSSGIIFTHGTWQKLNYTGPVDVYRAPIDGSGPVLGRQNIELLAPGPNGQWLAKREVTGDEGTCQPFVVDANGSTKEIALASPQAEYECPLGWFNSDPLIWRPTRSYDIGDIWLAGASPKVVLEDVPLLRVGDYNNYGISGDWMAYANGGAWIANLRTGERRELAPGTKSRVSIRAGLK